MGRPIRYGGEFGGFNERASYMAEIAPEALADIEIEDSAAFRRVIKRVPHGLVLVIAPWNYPYMSTRKALLSKSIDLANKVRGLLKIFGIRLPRTVKHGSFDGVVRPMIEMDEALAHAMLPLLDVRLVLYQHFLGLDRRVKRAASQDDVGMRMMTVPGVGPIAALTFKAAVDDPARFKRSRTVAAHFGLTPRRFQSGEHDNPGRISKAGDRDVRATLYAAANVLLMRTMAGSQIKSWGMRLMRTKGRHRAVVVIARKLSVLLHRMWADGAEFRSEKTEGMA